jgi:preprotein translocase subunit SecE
MTRKQAKVMVAALVVGSLATMLGLFWLFDHVMARIAAP